MENLKSISDIELKLIEITNAYKLSLKKLPNGYQFKGGRDSVSFYPTTGTITKQINGRTKSYKKAGFEKLGDVIEDTFVKPSLNNTYAEIEQVRQAIKVESGADSNHTADAASYAFKQPDPLPFIDDEPQNATESRTSNKKPSAHTSPQQDANNATNANAWQIQVGGDHYKKLKIQPMEYALANKLDYAQANVVKYVTRHADKNGKEDLLKAIHNIQLMIEHYYAD